MQENNQNSPAELKAEASENGNKKKCLVKFKKIIGQKKVWITAIVLAILVLLAGIGYYYKGLFIAATVNGHPITRLSVIKELEKQGGKDTLDMLINKQLIQNEAKAKGITVSQGEIDQEMKKYEDQFNVNGHTLDDTLAAQNMSRDGLKEQIVIQKEVEKLLGDKVAVSDDEVNSYITSNGITLPQGQEDAAKAQIKDQLQQQKLGDQSGQLITDLRSKANIKTFVTY
ncbi:MAG: SurA N-terminal domain-containing protein [Patescibacteria group bacterium]|nr:SurA N-terminal domain-containing protein [Patescibacteria group bacterium]